MTKKIQKLPKQLANQIAAGEVVERPISVVKELVENSLDAGASKIEITLKEGGIRLIEVRDNGDGIAPDDLSLALEKYSTSKISSLQDLYEVMSFGFRGEALASISSVSEFTMSSKRAEDMGGTKIFSQGGEYTEISEVAHETGTIVRVENIFLNTPARFNYLKKPRTEYSKILQYIEQISLAYPEVMFRIVHDEKETLNFPVTDDVRQRIFSVYGEEMHDALLDVSYTFDGIKLSGYISHPRISFGNKNKQVLFVNRRPITSPMISKAIFDAYNRFIPHGKHPGYVLYINIDPTVIDVNVHPRKLELRFANESSVFRSVYHGIKNELERASLSSISGDQKDVTMGLGGYENGNIKRQEMSSPQTREQYYTGSGTKFKNYSPYTDRSPHPGQVSLAFNKEILSSNKAFENSSEQRTESLTQDITQSPYGKILGQIHNAYILVQGQNGLLIFDQHALAERVIYEKMSSSHYELQSQQILGGIGMQLDRKEFEILEEYGEMFEAFGFLFNTLSGNNIILESVPDVIGKKDIESIFKAILGDMTELGSKTLEEVKNKIITYTACRSAIKFGDPLNMFEIHALLQDASDYYSATCPHGRTVVFELSLDELQKKYSR